MLFSTQPRAQGLYDPAAEHDACGVAVVAGSLGRRSHSIVADGLTAVANLEHRGAAGAEPTSGAGAGIQVPDALLRADVDFELSAPAADGSGACAVGLAFLPVEDDLRAKAVELIERIAAQEQLRVLGWREPRCIPTPPTWFGGSLVHAPVRPARRYLR